MSKVSLSVSLILAVAVGAIWGVSDAIRLNSQTLHLPGSGDPWLHMEGLLLYAGIALVSAAVLYRWLPPYPVAAITAPLFVLLLLLGLFEINSFLSANFISWQGILCSIATVIVAAALFWLATKALNPLYSLLRFVTILGFVAALLLSFWHSPLHRQKLDAGLRSSKPNVVLITMDTTRADHLTPYGYSRDTSPFLAKLAAGATLFENAYSVSSWTLPSHSSIFTGKLPSVHGAIYTHWWLDSGEATLAEMLKSNGYRTAGFISGPFLLPSFNIHRGFDYYNDQLDPFSGLQRFTPVKILRRFTKKRLPWIDGQRDGRDLTDAVLSWWKDQDDSSPFFLFINYFDPHDPYRPPPPFDSLYDRDYKGPMDGTTEHLFKNRETGERIGSDGHPLSAADYRHLVALYDGEIGFMDQQIERLLGTLQKSPSWSNTIVILMADHGESLGDHHLLDHGHTLYEEQIRIPLIMLGPGIPAGKRIAPLVRSIDVLPSLLEELHLPVPRNIQGASFIPYLNGAPSDGREYIGEIFQDPDTRVKPFKRFQKSIREGDVKLLWSSDHRNELYDLMRDPHELDNQIGQGAEAAGRLEGGMFQYLKGLPQRVLEKEIPLDEQALESLEANSYIH